MLLLLLLLLLLVLLFVLLLLSLLLRLLFLFLLLLLLLQLLRVVDGVGASDGSSDQLFREGVELGSCKCLRHNIRKHFVRGYVFECDVSCCGAFDEVELDVDVFCSARCRILDHVHRGL